MQRLHSFLIISACTISAAVASITRAEETTAEWSSRVWSAASEGQWETVETLLERVPEGSSELLASFRSDLELYQQHRLEEAKANTEAREHALSEMRSFAAEGNVLQAMKFAIEAQTLSDDFDSVLYDEDTQRVLKDVEAAIETHTEGGNVLVAQTLAYYLRTFFEDTSRRDLFEFWSKQQLELVNDAILLRYYAPVHHHKLNTEQAELRGDDPPEPLQEKSKDLWIERVDDISRYMVIQSLRKAEAEHMDQVSWGELLQGGLEAIRRIGLLPEMAETFPKLSQEEHRVAWLAAIDEEVITLPQYLRHISGHKTLKQLLDRVLLANNETLQLPDEVLLREFGDGAMRKLDKYSAIIWPNEKRQFDQATEGNFVGVGIVIRESSTGEILVVNPIDGSPAYYGGVVPEDIITHVNGASTSGWSVNDAVDKITGKRGTGVTLTIKRETQESPLDLQLTRDNIILRSVHGWNKIGISENGEPIWDWYVDPENHIGYIKLTGFSKSSYADMLAAIRDMQEVSEPNGLILDLRHNPGGLLPVARQISNLFIKDGSIVSGENANGDLLFSMQAYANRAYLSDWPLVILINQGSASASEIVSGSVQAHGAGIILGQRSWGKGSVQTVHNIGSGDQALVKLTTQFYRLPPTEDGPGRLVHKREGSTDWGVLPDIEVAMSPNQISSSNELRRDSQMLILGSDNADLPDVNDLLTKGLDPQLETALLLLRANALTETYSEFHRASIK
ncbi:MAG: S41 family peptidase [Phycisphaerales bacterium]|jgi:carboxyl-terminal processing protease|nr:S41 family peptidase [Phycisphaerales bacterium]